jgi:hypothetical protein
MNMNEQNLKISNSGQDHLFIRGPVQVTDLMCPPPLQPKFAARAGGRLFLIISAFLKMPISTKASRAGS